MRFGPFRGSPSTWKWIGCAHEISIDAADRISSPGPSFKRAAKKRRHLPHDAQPRLRLDDDDLDHPVVEKRARRDLRAAAVLSRVRERDESAGRSVMSAASDLPSWS